MAGVPSIFTSCLHPSSFHQSSPPVKLFGDFAHGQRSANGIICALTPGNCDQHLRGVKYCHRGVDVKNKSQCWYLHCAHGCAYCLGIWINTRKVLIKLNGYESRVSFRKSGGVITCMVFKIVKPTCRTDWRNSGSFITWSTKLDI